MADENNEQTKDARVEKPAEKTVADLRAELVEFGFDEIAAKGIKTKEALIATIGVYQAKELISTVATATTPPNPKEDRATEVNWQAKADRFAKHLEEQEKVRVLIPLEGAEAVGEVKETMEKGIRRFQHIRGTVWSKTFNGYTVIYPKGKYVQIPLQIADNISQELDQTQRAGEHLKIDRIDPKTGRPVRDQLS